MLLLLRFFIALEPHTRKFHLDGSGSYSGSVPDVPALVSSEVLVQEICERVCVLAKVLTVRTLH